MAEKKRQIALGVNIDHVATLRNARGENDPSVLELAKVAEAAGADLITVHLREDRRHIQDADIEELKKHLHIPLNFEMALSDEILRVALTIEPTTACIVPERREEVTTEGGLDVLQQKDRVKEFVKELLAVGTESFLFIEPDLKTVHAAKETGAKGIEFHTGAYARAFTQHAKRRKELDRLVRAAEQATVLGLEVHAGHGLNYHNIEPICAIEEVVELNIGHAIIARSLATGLSAAIRAMKETMR